jgi:hypothetical protein
LRNYHDSDNAKLIGPPLKHYINRGPRGATSSPSLSVWLGLKVRLRRSPQNPEHLGLGNSALLHPNQGVPCKPNRRITQDRRRDNYVSPWVSSAHHRMARPFWPFPRITTVNSGPIVAWWAAGFNHWYYTRSK